MYFTTRTSGYSCFTSLLFIFFHYLTYIIYKSKIWTHVLCIIRKKLPCIYLAILPKIICFTHTISVTRTKDSLHYEIYRSSMGQRSIKYKGSMLWNSVLEELKDTIGTSTFINKLKEFLIDK